MSKKKKHLLPSRSNPIGRGLIEHGKLLSEIVAQYEAHGHDRSTIPPTMEKIAEAVGHHGDFNWSLYASVTSWLIKNSRSTETRPETLATVDMDENTQTFHWESLGTVTHEAEMKQPEGDTDLEAPGPGWKLMSRADILDQYQVSDSLHIGRWAATRPYLIRRASGRKWFFNTLHPEAIPKR